MLAVISFDATDPARLERLVAEGRLPALSALRRRGQQRTLEMPPLLRLLDGATFHTLATGQPAERHRRWLAAALEGVALMAALDALRESAARAGEPIAPR